MKQYQTPERITESLINLRSELLEMVATKKVPPIYREVLFKIDACLFDEFLHPQVRRDLRVSRQ